MPTDRPTCATCRWSVGMRGLRKPTGAEELSLSVIPGVPTCVRFPKWRGVDEDHYCGEHAPVEVAAPITVCADHPSEPAVAEIMAYPACRACHERLVGPAPGEFLSGWRHRRLEDQRARWESPDAR